MTTNDPDPRHFGRPWPGRHILHVDRDRVDAIKADLMRAHDNYPIGRPITPRLSERIPTLIARIISH